jgi:hypothetical protein
MPDIRKNRGIFENKYNMPKVKLSVIKNKSIGIIDWTSLNENGSLVALGNGHRREIVLYDVQSKTSHVIWKSKGVYTQCVAFHPFNSNYIACCDQENIGIVDWKEKKFFSNYLY